MQYIYNDGGRSQYFKGTTGDCAYCSTAIVTGKTYREVYDELNDYCKREHKVRTFHRRWGYCYQQKSSVRTGVKHETLDRYLESMGWKFVWNNKWDRLIAFNEIDLPKGKIIVELSGHYVAVIDGVVYDRMAEEKFFKIYGNKGIVGYWYKPEPEIIYIKHYSDVSYSPEQIDQMLAK